MANVSLLDLYRARFGQAIKRQGNGWNGPCPLCGGEPGKSDRFMVWPERDDHLGEICAEHNIRGIWSCRKCGASGDTIAYLVKCDGMDFKAALGELGIEGGKKTWRHRRAPAEPKAASKSWEPKEATATSSTWSDAAMKLVASGQRHLPENALAAKWLAGRGIDAEAVAWYRLGWLPPESDKYQGRFRPRSSFGLEPKVGQDGKTRTKLFIPRGIVVPTFDAAGRVANIRIRRHKEDLTGNAPKYLELEGSQRAPLVLAGSAPRQLAAWFIVEAELDAMLIHHASGGVVGAIAVRTNRGKPDARAHALLQDAARVLVALDYDEAGAEGVDFWLDTYRTAMRWPTPQGKDPGDAFALGVDTRAWIAAGLPGCVSLPDEITELHGSNISQESIAAQCFAGDGRVDTSASGQIELGGGGAAERGLEKAENADSDAGQDDVCTASGSLPDMPPCGSKSTRMASEDDFNNYDLNSLRGALDGAEKAIGDIPLDVARLWLKWRHIPAVWRASDRDFHHVGSWDLFDWQTLSSLTGFIWDNPAAFDWLELHPADEVTPQNLFKV